MLDFNEDKVFKIELKKKKRYQDKSETQRIL